jgi:ribosomal protein S18 acetylase RimI-like enzyme
MTERAHVLDNPVWAAATGAHTHLLEVYGQAARYHPDVTPLAALRCDPDERAWADLTAIAASGDVVGLAGVTATPPPHWEIVDTVPGVQLAGTSLRASTDTEAVRLSQADVPEMLDLAARTGIGLFGARAIELGTHLGIRRDGRLVAMAGERVRPPGWTEISAVCTDAAHRGQGLATRLIRAVTAGIHARGETVYLHAAASNTAAIRLYEAIGFTPRRTTTFRLVRIPDQA